VTKKQSEIIHSKVLEERVKQIEDKSKIRTDHLQTQLDKQKNELITHIDIKTDYLQTQLDKQKNELLTYIDGRSDTLKEKIEDHSKYFIWGLTIIAFILTLAGGKAIAEYVKRTINLTTESKVTKYFKEKNVEKLLNTKIEEIEKVLEIKGEDFIEELRTRLKKKLNELDVIRKDYEVLLDTLKERKEIEIEKPVPEEVIKSLDGFTNSLKKIKEEEHYTYDDWFYKAENEFYKNNYKNAIRSFSNALKIKNEYNAYINRGTTYGILKNYVKALEDFDEAIKLDNSNPAGYAHRSWVYLKQNDYEQALRDANAAIDLDPDFINALSSRSQIYLKKNEYEKAIKDLTKAVELNPEDPIPYINRGWAYSEIEEYEIAKQDFAKAIELDDKNVVAHINLCDMMIFTGNYEEAFKGIDKIIKLSSKLEYKALGFYLQCTVYKLLNKDTSEPERKFYDILNNEFTINWSFNSIDNWLEKSDISDDLKKYISELINLLKEKMPK
jgi:tetratricopeptide (TPR) repeat protein